eukprot:612121-Rhodomonas_salina.1
MISPQQQSSLESTQAYDRHPSRSFRAHATSLGRIGKKIALVLRCLEEEDTRWLHGGGYREEKVVAVLAYGQRGRARGAEKEKRQKRRRGGRRGRREEGEEGKREEGERDRRGRREHLREDRIWKVRMRARSLSHDC